MEKKNTKEEKIDDFEHVYKPIDSSKSYDRKTFVDSFGDFSDLEGYVKKLQEDPRNPDATSDLGALLLGNPQFFSKVDDPFVTRKHAEDSYSQSVEEMAQYTKRNFDDFLNKFEDEEVLAYIHNVPLYKMEKGQGKEKHNKFVDSLNKIREVQKIAKEGDIGKMSQYVAEKMQDAPDWLKSAFAGSYANERYIGQLFEGFASNDQKRFEKMILDSEGKEINRTFLEGVVRDSLDSAHKQKEKEEDNGTQNDIWKQDIRPCYTALAGMVYNKEKAKMKKDKNPEKEKRKVDRKKLGMSQ